MKLDLTIKEVNDFKVGGNSFSYTTLNNKLFLDKEELSIKTEYAGQIFLSSLYIYESNTGNNYRFDLKTRSLYNVPKEVMPGIIKTFLGDHFLVNKGFLSDGRLKNNYSLFSIFKNDIVAKLNLSSDAFYSYKLNEEDVLFRTESAFIVYNLNSHKQKTIIPIKRHELGTYDASVFSNSESKAEVILLWSVIGNISDTILFSTNSQWLIGVDIETGKLSWTLKGLPGTMPYASLEGQDRFYDTRRIKLDAERNVIYCFEHNVYWEWDISTQQLITLVHKTIEATEKCILYNGHDYFKIDNLIYYSYGGMVNEYEGRQAWPKLVCVDAYSGEVQEVLEFKKKRGEKEIHQWKDFQYANGKFYLLDFNNVLRIIEK